MLPIQRRGLELMLVRMGESDFVISACGDDVCGEIQLVIMIQCRKRMRACMKFS